MELQGRQQCVLSLEIGHLVDGRIGLRKVLFENDGHKQHNDQSFILPYAYCIPVKQTIPKIAPSPPNSHLPPFPTQFPINSYVFPLGVVGFGDWELVILIIGSQQYRKMIISNQEVAVHLKLVRNLSSYTSGRFALRLSLAAHALPRPIHATPVNLIEKDAARSDNRTEFDEQCFLSRAFPLKSGAHVELQEVFLFKFDEPIEELEQPRALTLQIELLQVDQGKQKIAGIYRGTASPSTLHEYLEIDFYEGAPCQIVGSLHRCLYKFSLNSQDSAVDLRTFCQRHWKSNAEEVLDFLESESARSYKAIAENYSIITKREVEINCTKRTQKKTCLRLAKDVAERPTELTEGDEETVADQQYRRRKRIFSTTREHRLERYQTSEQYLHETAQKIYTIWRQLLGSLFSKDGDQFVNQRAGKHLKRLREKAGESIASFKGSWDVDVYGDEEGLRNQLAHQLRSQNKEYFTDMLPDSALPHIANDAFFSNIRPIIFEERALPPGAVEEEPPHQILVFLVHGLGACRLDMQKLKVELKRYFDGRVRVYASSSNEGRTEGDIDSMGMRLAAEVDYELTKHVSIPRICMVGHSMGGLIIRAALPRLEKYKQHFHSLITLSSPHLGYAYSASKLVDAGLWLLNAMKKCTSILQMTMQDHEQHQETFLYKLAHKPGLEWFKKVVLLGSHQDLYVPYYSARLQKHEESSMDCRRQVAKGVNYCEMVDSLLGRVKGSITRLNVNFCIPEQNIDNLIGRAAHISFITNLEMLRTLVIAGQSYFF